MLPLLEGDIIIYDPPYSVSSHAWRARIGKEFVVIQDFNGGPGDTVEIAEGQWVGFYADEIPEMYKHRISRKAFRRLHHASREPSWEI